MIPLIITSDLVRALGWTLLHSLWIGAGVFVLTVIGLSLTQRSSSAVRYRMLTGFLLLFLFTTVLAGFLQFRSLPHHTILKERYTAGIFQVQTTHIEHGGILAWIDGYAGWIVFLWAIVLLFRTYRLCRSLNELQQLRSAATLVSTGQWQDRLASFSKRLKIPRNVVLLESVKVSVPLTLGHFRPVIIVPAGFLFELPYAQAEAILFHELAHIYRKDYLFNLLQHVADTIFFFNPGWVWLSRLIREQREICCDDMMLKHTSHKTEYLKGLLAFDIAHDRFSPIQLSVKGSPLARRLYRMIENRDRPTGFMTKAIALLIVLALPLAAFVVSGRKSHVPVVAANTLRPDTVPPRQKLVINNAVSQPKPKPKPRQAIKETKPSIPADTAFRMASIRFEKSNEDMANRIMTVKDWEGNTYHVQIAQNELVALSINETVIPEEQLPGYLGLLARIDDAWNKARAGKALAMARLSADGKKGR